MLNLVPAEFAELLRRNAKTRKYAVLRSVFSSKTATEDEIERAFASTEPATRAMALAIFFRREYRKEYPASVVERFRRLMESTSAELARKFDAAYGKSDFYTPLEISLLRLFSLTWASFDDDDFTSTREYFTAKNFLLVEVAIRATAMANQVSDELRLQCFRSAPHKLRFVGFMHWDADPGLPERVAQIKRLSVDPEFRDALSLYYDRVVWSRGGISVAALDTIIPPPIYSLVPGDWGMVQGMLALSSLDFLRDRILAFLAPDKVAQEEALKAWGDVELREPIGALFAKSGRSSLSAILSAYRTNPEPCRALFLAREKRERITALAEFLRDASEIPPVYDELILETGGGIFEHAYDFFEREACRDSSDFSELRAKASAAAVRLGEPLRVIAEVRLAVPSTAAFAAALLCELPGTEADDHRISGFPLGTAVLALSGRSAALRGREPATLARALSDFPALERNDFWIQVIRTAWENPDLAESAKAALESFVGARFSSLEPDEISGTPEFLAHLATSDAPRAGELVLRVLNRRSSAADVVGPAVARSPERFIHNFISLVESDAVISDGVVGVALQLPDPSMTIILERLSLTRTDLDFVRILNRLSGGSKVPAPVCAFGLARIGESENVEPRVQLSKAISRQCDARTARGCVDSIAAAVEYSDERIAENLARMVQRLKIKDERISGAASARLRRESGMKQGLKKLLAETVAR